MRLGRHVIGDVGTPLWTSARLRPLCDCTWESNPPKPSRSGHRGTEVTPGEAPDGASPHGEYGCRETAHPWGSPCQCGKGARRGKKCARSHQSPYGHQVREAPTSKCLPRPLAFWWRPTLGYRTTHRKGNPA